MTIFTIHHRKGGVGKTSTVQHFAKAVSKSGIKTLAIDMDGQANLTMSFNVRNINQGLADVFRKIMKREKLVLSDFIIRVNKNLDLLPGTSLLFKVQDEISNFQGMRGHLLTKIKNDFLNYSVVIIDTPPQSSWLVSNALLVADQIIAPISCETFAVDGLVGLSESLEELGYLNNQDESPLKLSYLVPTMYHGSRKAHREFLSSIRKEFGSLVTKTMIRVDANIESAQSNYQSVFEYSPNTRSAEDYLKLAEEILG